MKDVANKLQPLKGIAEEKILGIPDKYNVIYRTCAKQVPFRMAPKSLTADEFNNYLKECKGFDKVLEKVTVISAENGHCIAELKVADEHLNIMKKLHGGLSATLVDSITSFALLTYERCIGIHSVSVDLHITYVKGAHVSDEVVIEARTLKTGRTLAYLECEIRNKGTGELLVKGSQTKFITQPRE